MSDPGRPTVQSVQKAVAARFRIPVEAMRASTRKRQYAHPRQLAMMLSRDLTNLSTVHIGRLFGGRDHTTVLHACKAIEKRMANNDYDKRHFDELRAELIYADNWKSILATEIQASMAIGLFLHALGAI